MATPAFRIVGIDLFERSVCFRLPFRFGDATVSSAPQAFVRARIAISGDSRGRREVEGAAAELMIPKWFDKSPDKTNDDNIDDLRRALAAAADAYTSGSRPLSAFGHFAAHHQPLLDDGARHGLNALTVNYGPALIDRALLDALCRAVGMSFPAAVRANLPGIDARLTSDLEGFAFDAFLATLVPASHIAARHTVGMLDALSLLDLARPLDDGLPQTLEAVIATYGNRYFKLKLSGQPDADIARLQAIAAVLERLPSYRVTLDGNEQFPDARTIAEFWRRATATPGLRRLMDATMYLEQPLARATALDADLSLPASLTSSLPLLIDESDAGLSSFVAARRCGYRGVSSKSCKGFYKSLLNAARCRRWNDGHGPRYFLSAEDLTTQAGLAVQQDLALAGLLGLKDVERNGHHYVDGFAGEGAPGVEQQRFLDSHPTLYRRDRGGVRLTIHDGMIDLSSLGTADFASAAFPEWASTTPLVRHATTERAQ